MSNDKLAVIDNVNGTALEAYQSRDEVRELADRLLSLHPQSKEVGQQGMYAVAQLALLVGASPLPGTNEIHVWKNPKTGQIQFQLGINYYRRKAEARGGVLWDFQPRQMRDDEREEYGVPNGMIAAVCKAVKRDDMEKYHAMGFPANKVWDMCGRAGIGTCRNDEGKVGRTPLWTAFKRAEVDLYRALFPTMMAAVAQAQQETVKISGPEWKEFSSAEVDDMFSYGDTPENQDIDVETGEYIEVDADVYQPDYEDFEPHVADDEEPEETAVPDPVHHDSTFWLESAKNANDLDGLAQALYQLHLPSGVFQDATATKKAVAHICGKDAKNEAAVSAIAVYVQAVADGTAKKEAIKAAEKKYLESA